MKSTEEYIALEDKYGAHNYHPLDIVISRAEGVWVDDVEGKRYMDCLSAYSAINQGHCHSKILDAFIEQAKKVTLTSRAFRNDKLPLFCEKLAKLSNMEMVLPMNSGAEAVETAVKAARKWGYTKKGIPHDKAEIVVCENNFHGRTTTVVGFSSEDQYRDGFGPFTPGFKMIPFGHAKALEEAITPNTCAFLVEPIQGEAGILIPPDGYLTEAQEICQKNNVLFMLDEIQSGLGRAGRMFAFQYEDVRPDAIIIGKALSAGFMPVSAVLANKEVLGVFNPGDHGSTFGGNPLACAVALAALDVLIEEKLPERADTLGQSFLERLNTIRNPHIVDVRGRGLFIGVELDRKARPYCERLKDEGLLCKETHTNVIRFAPPLVITEEELGWAFERIKKVLESD
ncbi:ornithine--oxo-acid transaminase [candidate division KSB1 bacterium]|nr:ornithine--oxo-acid transaminase [candidate division KSB1 bacterium]NIS24985.1 ornithine--oxo-acid transaminase [candidate division KSB1 bacterium]NIT71901.1 ornithine--oxo-acid transaminase [candidate division KSB1 bacterium]NIU25640.1 ornithine--oxo-acid transaminase [candidate division KSB1 bacterium]NIU93295.1 ornithine--oxo-acid transaminase [candidate division KSB1 bacterium]